MDVDLIKKLRTERGASLMVSLLLFLVCATLGSVVLTAGTAASGRIASMSEMDQRYYSVTSAAELVANELTDKTVTITRISTTVNDGTPVYETQIDFTGVSEQRRLAYLESEGKNVCYNSIGDPQNLDFLTQRAVDLMFGSNRCNTEAAMSYSFAGNTATNTESIVSFTVRHSGTAEGIDAEKLDVKADCTVKPDGTMLIKLYNVKRDGEEDDGKKYTLLLTLTPSFDETENTSEQTSYAHEGTTTTLTVTKTSSVKWSVASVRKEVATPDE